MRRFNLAIALSSAALTNAQANASFVQCLGTTLGSNSSSYVLPTDPSFQQRAPLPYNLDYLVVPAAVTYPSSAEQVAGVVKCAHSAGVAVQARSGGHSYGNYGLGGFNGSLVVDMKNLGAFAYNQGDQTVKFGPGNLLGNLSEKLQPLGRVMAYGEVGVIGTGGHMTMGGLGQLSRQLGLAIDQVVSTQCVLANGSIVTASSSTNPDLFFAIQGAGFSFAIVTEFTMKTAAAPSSVTNYLYNVTARDATSYAPTFAGWQNFVAQSNLDRRFSSTITLSATGMIIAGTFYGPKSDFDALKFSSFVPTNVSGTSSNSLVIETPFQGLGDPIATAQGSFPVHFYAKSVKTTNKTLMSTQAINSMFSYINSTDKGSPIWLVIWDLEGGAVADVPQTSTAYWNRDTLYFMQNYIVSLAGSISSTSVNFLSGLSALVQNATGADQSAYPGYVDPMLAHPQTSYWGNNVGRLQQIKASLDPDNVFRNPQSISVAKANGTGTGNGTTTGPPPSTKTNGAEGGRYGLVSSVVITLAFVVVVALWF